MKALVAACLLLLATNRPLAAQQSDGQRAVLHIDKRRVTAVVEANLTALESMLSKDLVYIHSSGLVETRDQFLDALRTHRMRYERFAVRERTIRVYGTTAIIHGSADMQVSPATSQRLEFSIAFTAVYALHGRDWKLVSWQSTRQIR